MVSITDLPSAPLVSIASLAVGAWCVHASYPGSVLKLLEKRASDSLFVQFTEGSSDCTVLVRTNSQFVTPVGAPATIALDFTA